jgi:hypothetical protein
MRSPRLQTALIGVLLLAASTITTACHKHREGPAERAGAKIDHAADRTGDAIEDAGRKVNRALPGD